MALILNIETSSTACSVCIGKDGELQNLREELSINRHASLLTVFIDSLLKELSIQPDDLDSVAVSAGPGSYTGLRIGLATAKGLCFSLSKPLIALDSLQIFAEGMKLKQNEHHLLFCPTIDARRNEIYYGLYNGTDQIIQPPTNLILNNSIPFNIPDGVRILISGSGRDKTKIYWQHPQLRFTDSIIPSSKFMVELAQRKFESSAFENISEFEPQYIKPVHIT